MFKMAPSFPTCWLKKLDEIAGGIEQKDLRAAWSGDHLIAELDTLVLEPRNLCGKILNYEVNAVPAAGSWTRTVLHRPPGGTGWAAEKQPQRTEGYIGEGWRMIGSKMKAEVLGVP